MRIVKNIIDWWVKIYQYTCIMVVSVIIVLICIFGGHVEVKITFNTFFEFIDNFKKKEIKNEKTELL